MEMGWDAFSSLLLKLLSNSTFTLSPPPSMLPTPLYWIFRGINLQRVTLGANSNAGVLKEEGKF